MKKFLSLIIIGIICTVLLTACANKNEPLTKKELELSGSIVTESNVLKDSSFPEDLTVKIVYTNGKKSEAVTVTSNMVTGFDTSTEGRKTAVISYEGLKTSFNYRVYTSQTQLYFYDGSGTEENPYQITTPSELQNISLALSDNFVLNNDIDCSGVTWTPIGNNIDETSPFAGSLDGKNHTINNLNVNKINVSVWESYKNTYNYSGLFGVVSGTVKNLILSDCTITATDTENSRRGDVYAGVLTGANFGTVTNITVNNSTVDATAWQICSAGAVCGSNLGIVNECNVTSSDISAVSNGWTANAGGITGASGDRLYYNLYAVVNNCSASQCEIFAKVTDSVDVSDIDYPSSTTYFGRVYCGGIGGLKVNSAVENNSVADNSLNCESHMSGEYIIFKNEQWGY